MAVLLFRFGMANVDDSLLVRQTLSGNQNAFKFLVLRYQRPIFKFLANFRLPQSVVEEIAQESFLRAYGSLETYDHERGASFSSWLFAIARNLALNELERKRHQFEIAHTDTVWNPLESVDDRAEDPQDCLERAEDSGQVLSAVHRLPEPFRQAVVLSYFQELSIKEIAEIENCSSGTVKSRIFRGKQLLKSILTREVK